MYVCRYAEYEMKWMNENVFGIQLSFQVQQHLVLLVIKNWTERDSHNTSSQVWEALIF